MNSIVAIVVMHVVAISILHDVPVYVHWNLIEYQIDVHLSDVHLNDVHLILEYLDPIHLNPDPLDQCLYQDHVH